MGLLEYWLQLNPMGFQRLGIHSKLCQVKSEESDLNIVLGEMSDPNEEIGSPGNIKNRTEPNICN